MSSADYCWQILPQINYVVTRRRGLVYVIKNDKLTPVVPSRGQVRLLLS